MFGHISLRVKLVGAFLVTALISIALSLFNIQAITQTRESFADIVENHMPRLNALQNMRVIVTKLDKEIYLYEAAQDTAERDQQKNILLADLDRLTDQERDYETIIASTSEGQAEIDEIRAAFAPVATAKEQTINTVFELIALEEQGASRATTEEKQAALAQAETSLERALTTSIEHDLVATEQESQAINARVEQIALFSVIASAVTSVFAIVVGLGIAITVVRNLNRLKEGSARLAGGDFSNQLKITSKDELGQLATAFNKMSLSLRSSYLRLALEKERDETLLESMSEGMVALDEQGRIVLINSVAADLLGVSVQETKDQSIIFTDKVKLLGQDSKSESTPPTEVLRTGEQINEVYAFQKGVRKVLLNIATSPVKLEGRTAGAILVLRDVTKEKEVDRMKTEFISLASHQLRTPLSAIKWFGEMLLNGDAGDLNTDQKEFAKNIADSTDRMVDLVNSLLNISRIESGRIIVDPHPTDLKELITGIVNDLKAKTEERQQALIISVHSDLPKINLDPRLIGQVYLNLLTNAIKYTPKKGEISVLVSKKGDEVISQVTDNGYGIPKEQQSRIFQKFFRAENVAKVETDGTGLGLYLIKAIIESSGGKIWFESEENKGTSFWFTLPLSGMKAKEGEVTLDV